MAESGENMGRRREAYARAHIAHEGDQNEYCHILLDGVLVQEKILEEGRRQIVGMYFPGDMCGLFQLPDNRMNHDLVALSPVAYLSVPLRWLSSAVRESRDLLEAMWREMSREATISAMWLANMGQRSAYQRLAHLICEMNVRLRTSGCDTSRGCKWIGTQTDLRAATGLSLVHVNKTLRRMEAEQLISCGRSVEVHDAAKLEIIADFDPSYLARDYDSLADMLMSRIETLEAVQSAAPFPRSHRISDGSALVAGQKREPAWAAGQGGEP